MNGFEYPLPHERDGWRAMAAEERDQSDWKQFRLTTVATAAGDTRLATDDWPFLYLREPMIPGVSLVETKAVVHMALLFGGTWIVNSV